MHPNLSRYPGNSGAFRDNGTLSGFVSKHRCVNTHTPAPVSKEGGSETQVTLVRPTRAQTLTFLFWIHASTQSVCSMSAPPTPLPSWPLPPSLCPSPDITFSPVTSSFLLPEVCRDWQRDDRMLVNTLSPKQTLVPHLWGLPVSTVKYCQSGQTAPRRLTQLQARDAGGDEHGRFPGARTTHCRTSPKLSGKAPWEELCWSAAKSWVLESFESPWKPPSLCLLPALRCWIWTSQYEINTPPQTLP